MQNATSATSYVTSGSIVGVGAWTANEIATAAGIALGLATFAVNWYYKHKHYQLAKVKAHKEFTQAARHKAAHQPPAP